MPLQAWTTRILVLPAFAIAASLISAAQLQQSALSEDPPDAPSAARKTDPSPEKKHQRTFGTVGSRSLFFPDIAASPGPLAPGGKFKLFLADSISFGAIAGATLGSAIAQADDSPEGYHQGWEGYGKRFGSSMARNASNEFFGTFLLASTLHQDPRFFPETNPTFSSSVRYSVRRLFITRSDGGKDVPNWSGLMGPLFSEGLANAYWPDEERDASHTFQRYGIDLATTVGTNMLRNYWPVFFKKIRH